MERTAAATTTTAACGWNADGCSAGDAAVGGTAEDDHVCGVCAALGVDNGVCADVSQHGGVGS